MDTLEHLLADGDDSTDTRLEMGLALRAEARDAEALPHFHDVLTSEPRNKTALLALSEIAEAKGDIHEAIAILENAYAETSSNGN